PAEDVKRGHLIVREDGGLTVAKSVKFGVTDTHRDLPGLLSPAVAEGLPEELLSSSEPPTKEDLKNEIEFKARKLNEERNYSLDEAVSLYKLLEMLGNTDRRLGKKTSIASWYTGAYVHGGVAGTRTNMKEFPHTTKFLVSLAKHYCGEVEFTALGLAMNAQLGLHRDLHNYGPSKNYVLPLHDFEKGALWVQDDDVNEHDGVEKELPSGKKVKGRLIEMEKGRPVYFSPRKWHEVQPWVGERLVLLLYTPRATKLHMDSVEFLEVFQTFVQGCTRDDAHDEELPLPAMDTQTCCARSLSDNLPVEDMGFNVNHQALTEEVENPDDEDYMDEGLSAFPSPHIKMMRQEQKPVEGCAEEEDYSFLRPQTPEELPPLPDHVEVAHNGVAATVRKMVKKAEVQYTKNIESLLDDVKESGKFLEVTHNVSLGDVRKNLEAWKPSALKEFKNLKDSKKAFSVKRRDELPPGCRIDDSNFDLFAAGVDATSLRTLLAANARKPWKIGTTDVRQAFVLAKWLGQPVALEPPAIAYELGLASQGQVWFVEQAIYGLRESPALWSRFRDEQLKLARWNMDVEGVPTTTRLQQMVSDNQVWKIVVDGGDDKVFGYVVVYIDDLLIHAEEGAMRSFFDWVSAKWEVDALDVLDYDHPIRFLGMEMHRVPGGVELAQEGFINEILRSHGHQGGRSQSQGPRETLILSDEEERALIDAQPSNVNPKDPQVKEAQRRVGELLWLMGRTRPDLQHTVSIMAARITRCPGMVNKVGSRLLDYLNETKHYRLAFTQDSEEIATQLDIYTDSSFAPSGGRSQGAAAVFYGRSPIVWRAGRQQLVTLSTAESELLETVEGTLLGLSTRGLLTELLGRELPLVVWADNLAAVALLTTSSGSWRTRHLRLRSNWVREMAKNQELAIKHVSGEFQRADLGTKPFTRERLRQLVAMWSMIDR
ncbi:GIP, partial [Symbiodinium sp. CCMP2456]